MERNWVGRTGDYLQLEQIHPLRIDVRSLRSERFVQALSLQRAASHCEVYESDAGAKVGGELGGRVARGQEDGESGRQVNVLVADGDQDSSTSATKLPALHVDVVPMFDSLSTMLGSTLLRTNKCARITRVSSTA